MLFRPGGAAFDGCVRAVVKLDAHDDLPTGRYGGAILIVRLDSCVRLTVK